MKNKLNPLKQLQYDLPASVVLFLVAMPLCLGIAMASGAPLMSGVIAGIIGGVVVGLLSGSALGVSGPAAGLDAIVVLSIAKLGGYENFLVAVVIGGIFQFLFGLIRGGFIAYYFPSSVIKGMLSGIGILIFLKQIPHAFGHDKDMEGDWEFLQVDGENTFSEIYNIYVEILAGNHFFNIVIVSIISLAILILWEQKFMKNTKVFSIIQAPFIVVLVGIGLAYTFNVYGWEISRDHLVNVPVTNSLSELFKNFYYPNFDEMLVQPKTYLVGFEIAVVASLQTLLCVEATDKLDPYYKRVTPTNRELMAQGAGNTLSGLIGGLPIAQVIVRSSTNIQSGGRTKASAILHGLWLTLSILFIPQFINMIPMATLAAILLVVGFKLAKPSVFKEMYTQGMEQFLPFITTIVIMLFTDLFIGVVSGLVVAIFVILRNNYRTPFRIFNKDVNKPSHITIELAHDLTFLNKASLLLALDKIPARSVVKIDASRTQFIHPDIIEIIEDFKIKAIGKRIRLEVIDLYENKVYEPLNHFDVTVNTQTELEFDQKSKKES